MSIKVCLALCIACISTFSLAQDEQDIDKKMLAQCQALASQLNKSQGAGISLKR